MLKRVTLRGNMGMIFPGMDPYLEEPQLWKGVHSRLVVYIADQLQPQLHPRFVAAIEERVYLEGPDRDIYPDVWVREKRGAIRGDTTALAEPDSPVVVQIPALEIHERYVTILDLQSGQKVVTVIEVLSPTNKCAGEGMDAYLEKQREVRSSDASLVEIDLLRAGQHVLAVPETWAREQGKYDYLVAVNRAKRPRDIFELYLCQLPQSLPRIRIPLTGRIPDVTLDLQAVVQETYLKGEYAERINYKKPCIPTLKGANATWARQLLKQKKPRKGAS